MEEEGAKESDLSVLLKEAEDAAHNDLNEASANEWTKVYQFPPAYVDSDVRCLLLLDVGFGTKRGETNDLENVAT